MRWACSNSNWFDGVIKNAMGDLGAARLRGRGGGERTMGRPSLVVLRLLTNQSVLQGLLIITLSFGLYWLVWIYGNGLRDPRYLDGWVLAGGMILQWQFHLAVKTARLSPVSVKRWRRVHIFIGYVVIAAFISHSNFTLPDTAFEWAMWLSFVLIVLSGTLNAYLSWSLSARHNLDDHVSYDRIPGRRSEIAHEVHAAITRTNSDQIALALPTPSYDAWISDLYTNHLRDFFQGPRNFMAHLVGSQEPLKQLTNEIDNLSSYVDANNKKTLSLIKNLVVEKDRLDFARVYFGLTRGCQFVHVPLTYALTVMVFMHVVVVYAFSSGDW